ncbi:MAG TPA: hypothetical protein VIV14_04670 [Gammaproteobacteria bacterium]
MKWITSEFVGFAALLAFGAFGHAVAQDGDIDIDVDDPTALVDDIDREPRRCINTIAIDETYIVDDETILFFMRNDQVYQNVLRNSCAGLKREKRFSYSILGRNLCRTDSITVLQSFGARLERGRSCGLGPFVEISEEQAEFLRYGERPQVEEEAVEVPEESDAEADAGAESD